MDLALGFIVFARIIGSFVCFQSEVATFSVGSEFFPVCSGCFGIYLGCFFALSLFPFLGRLSKRLYTVRFGLPLLLPLVVYWVVLNVQAATGTWVVPAVKEVYAFAGLLFGVTVSNGAYNLGLETSHAGKTSAIGRNFWTLALLAGLASLVVFFLYRFETWVLFVASVVFVIGLFGLVGFIALWVIFSLIPYVKRRTSVFGRASIPVLEVLIILACFMFFQVLIVDSRTELVLLGLLFGAVSFGLFAYSVRNFALSELGLVTKDWKKQVLSGVLLGFVLYLAFVAYRFVLFSSRESVFAWYDGNYLAIAVIFAIASSEEFFFRGYAIPTLERSVNTVVSCLISSIFFVVYHQTSIFRLLVGGASGISLFDYEHMAILFAGSVLLSYLFVRKRSLIMPITVHFTWDLLVFAGAPIEILPIAP